MANMLYESDSVQDIADAIRTKNGSTTKYKISEMAGAINALSGGGGSSDVTKDEIIDALGYTPANAEDIPTKLPSPNALTVKIGEAETVYDGSAAKTVNFNNGLLDPIWVREQIADMMDDYTDFNPLNTGVAAYLAAAETTYTADNQSVSIVANYTSQGTDDPDGLAVDAGASTSLALVSVASKAGWTQPSADKIYNLIPNTVYAWTGSATGTGKARATSALRMIRMTGVRNVRDLGGWPCDGGIVQYGKIFRGGQLSNNNVAVATEWDIAELNAIGIKVELDIRAASEQDRTTSILGSGVEFISIPTAYSAVALMQNHPEDAVAILNAVFTAVAAGKPIYFHCQAGADRTGTIAFILLALLGVSHVDLDIDYELTSFYDLRKRSASPWPEQWTYVNSFAGDSPKEKVTAWALSNGITQAQIDAFRSAMIYTGFIAGGNDTPTQVTYPVTLSLTSCSSSNEASSVTSGATYSTTITADEGHTLNSVTVTMGGADVTSTAVSGNVVTISNATGAIVITAVAVAAVKTNMLTQAVDSDGQPYNSGTGYKSGYRLNSAGNEAAMNGYSVTGFIPVAGGQKVTVENLPLSYTENGQYYIGFYDANYTLLSGCCRYAHTWIALTSGNPLAPNSNDGANILSFTLTGTSTYPVQNAKYLRLSSTSITTASAVYIE